MTHYTVAPIDSQRRYGGPSSQERARTADIHPDGQPWSKCCVPYGADCDWASDAGCACTRGNICKENFGHYSPTPFVCIHRKTSDGFFRVCAGWHALATGIGTPGV